MTVRDVLERHGSYKITCDYWRIKGPISPQQRMERVLEFWSAGDIVPRNPFLHRSLWSKENRQQSAKEEDEHLAGYERTAEDDRILSDIHELET